MRSILGITVADDLFARWAGWMAPAAQPFFVDDPDEWPAGVDVDGTLTPELRDTFRVWRIDDGRHMLWLDEPRFSQFDRQHRARLVRAQVKHRRGAVPTVRAWAAVLGPEATTRVRAQADGHRFVWWPSLLDGLDGRAAEVVARFVDDGTLAHSRHDEVSAATWRSAANPLPRAKALAGTFAEASDPNCFGAVLGAAGVEGAEDRQVRQEPFESWLSSACRPGGRDGEPGTVLVWRDRGVAAHAAVTLGDGWAFEKPAQCWYAPRVVLPVGQLIRANRAPGQRLQRYRLTPAKPSPAADRGGAGTPARPTAGGASTR